MGRYRQGLGGGVGRRGANKNHRGGKELRWE
jgi:hypothetical protein